MKLSTLIATRGNGIRLQLRRENISTVANEQLSYPTGIAVKSKGVDAANNVPASK